MKGINWYSEVNYWCMIVSNEYKLPLYKVCGILSALSPQNKFDRNLEDVISLIETNGNCKVSTFGSNKEKAIRILNANNIGEVFREFKGLKTRAFFLNLYKVYDTNVTVDLWMIRLYKHIITTKSLTNKSYKLIEKEIQKEANKNNVYPNQMQAILWTQIRGSEY